MVLQGLARRAGAKWVVDATSQELSKILIGPLGIQSVLRGFLDVVTHCVGYADKKIPEGNFLMGAGVESNRVWGKDYIYYSEESNFFW